jgi:adenylate kinase family enzyme
MAHSTIFVIGGPGAGKGTQCALLRETGYTHFSAGELLRAEVSTGSAEGVRIEAILREGKLVPSSITCSLLARAMRGCAGPYLIDGFPRSMENLETFQRDVGPVDLVLFIDVSDETMSARLIARGQSSGRSDDAIEVIAQRLVTFHHTTMPVVEHLRAKTTVHTVCGNGSVQEVFDRVCQVLCLGGIGHAQK